jgi:hypothetical protein
MLRKCGTYATEVRVTGAAPTSVTGSYQRAGIPTDTLSLSLIVKLPHWLYGLRLSLESDHGCSMCAALLLVELKELKSRWL